MDSLISAESKGRNLENAKKMFTRKDIVLIDVTDSVSVAIFM